MGVRDHSGSFRVVDAALVRATSFPGTLLTLPWPDLEDESQVETWCGWLAEAWAHAAVVEAVTVASPALAGRLEDVVAGRRPRVAQVRSMVVSLGRYLVRMRGRATPFGMFAGVAPLRFADGTSLLPRSDHRVRARADARWLAEVIARLEASGEVRSRLPVVVNDLAVVRGERVVVTWAPHARPAGRSGFTLVSVRRSRAVEAVLEAARSPIRGGDLIGKLAAELPRAPLARLEGMLAELMSCGVLVSRLRPPATSEDGLGHIVACLEGMEAHTIEEVAPLAQELRQLQAQLTAVGSARATGRAHERMTAVARVVEQPLMVDLRLGGTLVLPEEVAREAAEAADALVRATPHPAGDPRIRAYHARFVERYGTGALVPAGDLIDATTGLGFPAHYDNEEEDREGGLDPRNSRRDERLLVLAQQAALDRAGEVVLGEEFFDDLAAQQVPGALRPAPHVEMCVEVHAPTVEALNRGDFALAVRGVSRSAVALSGRFWDLLDPGDRQRALDRYGRLPVTVEGAVAAQLSCPPRLQRLENVARAPRLLPTTLALAEHREPAGDLVRVADLAVTADGERMYVVSLSRRRVLEPVVANAAARRAWPPLARLLVDIARSGTAVVSPFAWGAASVLPFLPRVRYQRSVLAPARWRLPVGALPAPDTPPGAWSDAMAALRDRLRLPAWVSVGEADRQLRLDLEEPMDLALLRAHADQAAKTGRGITLAEAPTPADHGWAGGRVHEIVVPLAATAPPAPPPAAVTRTSPPLIGRDHGVLPGERVVFAKLYGHPDHVDAILTGHLGRLLADLGEPMAWFIRYRQPSPHLRLRLHASPGHYGKAVVALGAWAADLRRRGLAGELTLDTYRPETARYGSGPVLNAAEALFTADSAAARAQIAALSTARHVRPRALTAASMVDLAAAMTGGRPAGMRWLLDRRHPSAGALVREEARQALSLTGLDRDQAALHTLAGGGLISEAWQARRQAAASYAFLLQHTTTAPSPDAVLIALLHLHHNRAIGIDPDGERLTCRIARAVALAWSARTNPRGGGL